MHSLQLRIGQQRAEVGAAEALAGARDLLQAHARLQRQPGRQRPQDLQRKIVLKVSQSVMPFRLLSRKAPRPPRVEDTCPGTVLVTHQSLTVGHAWCHKALTDWSVFLQTL